MPLPAHLQEQWMKVFSNLAQEYRADVHMVFLGTLDNIQYDWRLPLQSQPSAQAMSRAWEHPDGGCACLLPSHSPCHASMQEKWC
jgi:hypothetical protein